MEKGVGIECTTNGSIKLSEKSECQHLYKGQTVWRRDVYTIGIHIDEYCGFTGQPQLTQRWVWETKPTIEICPDSNMSIEQVFDAMEYWIEEDVYVTIQRVRKVEHCDPSKLNVIQVHDHIDFDRDTIPRDDQSQMVLLWDTESTTIYYIDRVRFRFPTILYRIVRLYYMSSVTQSV